MDHPPYSELERGSFLIATPEIDTGIFFRAVILLCEHNTTGSFGLVVNKKMELNLPDEIKSLGDFANPRIGIRAGGPVQSNQMMLLHTSSDLPQQTLPICEDVFLGGDMQFLQEALNSSNGPEIRLCFGYTGWSAGQLEREFLDGRWYLQPASRRHIFHTAYDKLWQNLLREMGGKYATLSMIPEDLSLN